MKTGEGQRRHNAKGECSCLMSKSKYVSKAHIKESLHNLYRGKYLRFFPCLVFSRIVLIAFANLELLWQKKCKGENLDFK